MAIKRKRSSDFFSSSSPSSSSFSTIIPVQQPPLSNNLDNSAPSRTTFPTFNYPLTKPFISPISSQTSPSSSSHDKVLLDTAKYSDSGRTRKRWRDARPREEDIHKKTLDILYEGAKRPVSPPSPPLVQQNEDELNMYDNGEDEAMEDESLGLMGESVQQRPLSTTIAGGVRDRNPSPHQLSLHRFWGGSYSQQQQHQREEEEQKQQKQQKQGIEHTEGKSSGKEENVGGILGGSDDDSVERTHLRNWHGGLERYLADPGGPWLQQGMGMTAQREGLQAASVWTTGVDVGDVVMA